MIAILMRFMEVRWGLEGKEFEGRLLLSPDRPGPPDHGGCASGDAMDGGGFLARAYVGPWDLPVGGDCGGGAPQNRFPE